VVGADRSSGVECPDFALLARAYGLPSQDIRDPADLESIAALLGRPGPVLIQIHVDRSQGFSPKLKSRMVDGRFLTPELDDMFPFLAPEELAGIRESAARIRALPRGEGP
jgi:acetolactate synthase-1/2/3 large subunit